MRNAVLAGGCAILLSACGSSIGLQVPSPRPSDLGLDTPAANLSSRFELLFTEHTMALGKMVLAGAAGREDEFHADAALLASNGIDVATLFSTVLGPSTASEIQNAWTAGENARVDYVVAAVTHDQANMEAATASLDTSVTQLSALLAAALKAPNDDIRRVAAEDASNFRNFVDEIAGGAYQTGVPDLIKAQFQSRTLGRLLVSRIVSLFPDRYPGDPEATPPTLRTQLAADFESGSYLLVALAAAAAAGNQPEQDGDRQASMLDAVAIGGGLGIFDTDTVMRFEATWDTLTQAIAAYAKSGDATSRRDAVAAAAPPSAVYGPDLTSAVTALIQVVDDIRGKDYARLSADDRAAASVFGAVGDAIAQEAIRDGKLI